MSRARVGLLAAVCTVASIFASNVHSPLNCAFVAVAALSAGLVASSTPEATKKMPKLYERRSIGAAHRGSGAEHRDGTTQFPSFY